MKGQHCGEERHDLRVYAYTRLVLRDVAQSGSAPEWGARAGQRQVLPNVVSRDVRASSGSTSRVKTPPKSHVFTPTLTPPTEPRPHACGRDVVRAVNGGRKCRRFGG